MSNKKILVFAPYGSWGVHHQVDAVIGAALRVRGSEVKVLVCDGLFEQCFIAGKPPSLEICRQCSDSGRRLFSMLNLPVLQMRSLLTDADFAAAKSWSDSLPVGDLATAKFEGSDLGDWISSTVHSYFLTGNLDFGRREVADMYRKQLRNGALIQRAMVRMLAEYRPDHVFSFNSLHSYYRVAFEMARKQGIPVLVHERGLVDDTFLMLPNSSPNHYAPRWKAWEQWKDVPLTREACRQVWTYFNDRENGKGTNYRPFYDFSSDPRDVRKILRIPAEGRIVAVFASTEREIGSIKGLIRRTFDTQVEWLRKIAGVMARKDMYLVIRHHPNNTSKGVVDKEFIKVMAELNLEYGDRVRVCMPYEKITSYAIVRNAEAVFTFYSTTEAEAVLRGVPATCVAESLYIPMGVDFVKNREDFPAAVDRALEKSGRMGVEDLRRAYRFAYYLFFKLNFRFASVGIRNVYEMDIRIRALEDLQPGRDAALDQVCRHVLENAPLYEDPSEQERRVSDREETEFLMEQMEAIRGKRVAPGSVPDAAPAPLVSLIRQPGGSENGRLARSLRRSRHKRLEHVTLPGTSAAGPRDLLQSLRAALGKAKGEFIFVAPENVAVDESLLSTSLDVFASGGEDVQAVTWAAWLADKVGNIQDEFLTESRPMADFRAALAAHPALKDPIQMLTFFVMRKSFLEKICDILQAIPLKEPQDISEQLFDSFWMKQGDSVHRTSLPMLIVYPPSSAAAAIEHPGHERAREETDPSGDADQAAMRETLLAYADKLEGAPYDRASILGSANLLKRMGNGGAALSMLNHYLGKNAADAEVQGLVRDWSAQAGVQAAAAPSASTGSARASANGMPASPMHSGSVAVASVQGASSARSVEIGEPAAWSAAPGNPFAGEKVYATYAEAKPLVETVSGWLLEGQEEFLFNMAKAVPEGGHILEMGADRGRSTAAIALACSGSDKRIFSIDTFCGNDGIMGKTHDFQHEWHANLARLGVDKHCEPLKGFTFEVIPTWSGRPMLDFVFIDASHEYIDVLKDFKLIYPYVKPGGRIAFHDVEPNWPGPWRVWLERAVPLLAEHKQVATLACGRKVAGRPWEYGEKRLGFSFAANWIDHLARTIQGGEALLDTMRASMAFGSAPEADRARILRQEQIFKQLPEFLVTTLRCMLGKDAYMDGYLHHWNGIVLMAQGKPEEARHAFEEATRVSYPVPKAQAGHYLAQLGGPARPVSFKGGSEVPGTAHAAAGNGYYGKEYFDWQKRIGAFGGVANLFKFRDHVKETDTVVDFGSGGGFLLHNLPGRIKLGVEINEVARKESSLKAGIDAFESVEDLSDGCADVIVSNHALEHVHSPLDTLKALRRKLKPDGRAVFVVPHDGPRIAYDPADVNKHLYTWNPMTLGNLFTAAGFEVLMVENIQHQWPPNFTEAYETLGEEGFHRACREQALSTGNHQVRIVAARGKDPVVTERPGRGWEAASDGEGSSPAEAGGAPAVLRGSLMDADKIPVALIAYKRPEHTARVLQGLKENGVRNLHIFCDAPRTVADEQAVARTRDLVKSVDWTRPRIHEASENRGLARSIMGAVDSLLAENETIILLEDDCVPQRHCFDFMRKCLTRYRDMDEVYGVSGYTVDIPATLRARYPFDLYFLPRIGSWGWATWKRAWNKLERDLRRATRDALDNGIDLLQGGSDIPYILNSVLEGSTKDVWTLNWLLTVYLNRGHFIYPTVSQIENIGMDGTGVHCGATEKYRTRLADREACRFPDRVVTDADLLANFRKYYDA